MLPVCMHRKRMLASCWWFYMCKMLQPWHACLCQYHCRHFLFCTASIFFPSIYFLSSFLNFKVVCYWHYIVIAVHITPLTNSRYYLQKINQHSYFSYLPPPCCLPSPTLLHLCSIWQLFLYCYLCKSIQTLILVYGIYC